MMITQEILRSRLKYSAETGEFVWLRSKRNMVGKTAGNIQKNGYRYIKIFGRSYRANRLAWLYVTGVWPAQEVDHLNHIRDDDRFCNLREATPNENKKNQSMYSTNTSGKTGVYLNRPYSNWRAMISVNGKLKHLGYFNEKEDAILARRGAEIKYGFHENHGQKRP